MMPSVDVVCFLKADSDVMENNVMEDLSNQELLEEGTMCCLVLLCVC